MVSESVYMALLASAVLLYFVLAIIDVGMKIYNRCKRRAGIRRRLTELGHNPEDHL